ncbi:MAG: sulfite exporter TauE/SafE family protein [Pseudomonadota bacterium]
MVHGRIKSRTILAGHALDSLTLLLVAALSFLTAGTIKGLAGIGLPTAAIAFMTLAIDPRAAIALVMFPMIGANAWQLFRGGDLVRTAKRYGVFACVLFIGVAATALATQDASDRILLFALGLVVLVFVAVSWRNLIPPLPDRWDRPAQIAFGLFAGVVGGMTAGWGAPLAMYLATRRVDKDEFVRASGFLIFVGSLPLCIAYAGLGFLTGPLAGLSFVMLVPTLIGFSLGEHMRSKLSFDGFRKAVLILFVFLGLNLIRRGVWYA